MAKQQGVDNHYKQMGKAQGGVAYDEAMRKAKAADENSYLRSAPVRTDPAMDAWLDNLREKSLNCCGCCESHEPTSEEIWQQENNSSCCVIS